MKLPRMLSTGAAVVALAASTLLLAGAASADSTVTPASITVTEYTTTGVTAVVTGFAAGETVNEVFGTEGAAAETGRTAVADADGTVTFTYVPSADAAVPGTYSLGGQSTLDADILFTGTFTVVADPEPARATVTVTPATLTVTQWATAGVTAVMTGFTPGEVVNETFATPGMGGETGRTAVADAEGTVTFRYVPEAVNAIAGTFYLGGLGVDSGTFGFGEITVVADPAAPAPAAPAAPVPARAAFTG